MIKKEQAEVSKSQNDIMKPWFDFMWTWKHPALEGVRGNDASSENGHKDLVEWWSAYTGWEKAGENWNRVLKGVSVKKGGMDEMSEAYFKQMTALHKIQDEWSDTSIQLFRTAYEMGAEFIVDDEIAADHFFTTLNSAGVRLQQAVEDYLKVTPFSELAPVLSAVKKSMEAFSEEKKVARAVLKEWFTTQRKVAKLCKTAVEEWASALENGREGGQPPKMAVRQILEEYVLLVKETTKNLDIPDEIKTHVETLATQNIQMNDKGLDSISSWTEMAVKFNRALFESTRKLFSFSNAHKLLAGGNFFQEGRDQFEIFIREIIRNSEISDGISEWISATAEFTNLWQAFSMNCLMPACLSVSQSKQTEASGKKQSTKKTPGKKNLDQIPAEG